MAHNILAFLLIGVFLLSGFDPELLHHHEEATGCHETHATGEVDSCHLALHHHDGIHKCEDHQHLVSLTFECALCHLTVGTQWLLHFWHETDVNTEAQSDHFIAFNEGFKPSSALATPPTRGPPRLA